MIMLTFPSYLVGLEDKSLFSSQLNENRARSFTLEESLAELSELSGAAGFPVSESHQLFYLLLLQRTDSSWINLSTGSKPKY